MFHRICCAYDGSRGAKLALLTGLRLAQEQGALLQIVTVQEAPPRYAATIDEVDEDRELESRYAAGVVAEAQRLAQEQGVAVAVTVRIGHAAQVIVRFLEEIHADLLVIGQSGHSEIWGRFLGSTVDKVVRHAPCSVLIVRGQNQHHPHAAE